MRKITEKDINNFEHKDTVDNFWRNIEEYIDNDTVIEEIDKVFPIYLIDNYETYQILFDKLSNNYNSYFKNKYDLDIDFNYKFSDAFKYLVQGLKDKYKENGVLLESHVDEIITDMYKKKYTDYISKNNIDNIINEDNTDTTDTDIDDYIDFFNGYDIED